MELTEEEVLQILNLIEKSSFDFLQIQLGDLKLTVSKGNYQGGPAASAVIHRAEASERAGTKKELEAKVAVTEAKPKAAISEERPKAAAAVSKDALPITAPMVGTFYTTPEPGAPPFVEVGSRVEEETTVGLIEVMKVFNAVQSRARGVIADICVQNGQFVEYGQTLFLVRPGGVSDKKSSSG